MEPQLTVENIPFVWGIAFFVNILIGIIGFTLIVRKNVTPWLRGSVMWISWWSFASALSLVISMVSGPMATFSYHQIGVLTETMVNIGLLFWAFSYALNNWYLTPEDWRQIEIHRAEVTHANKLRELNDDPKH